MKAAPNVKIIKLPNLITPFVAVEPAVLPVLVPVSLVEEAPFVLDEAAALELVDVPDLAPGCLSLNF